MGNVISLGQIVVDTTLRVPSVPVAGEDIFASSSSQQVGGGYNLLHAVRQMGQKAYFAGLLGTGPHASLIRETLENEDIKHIGATRHDCDNGFSIALTDNQAERTFISVRGAEAEGDPEAFDQVDPEPADVVYLSGYTLVHRTAQALLQFLQSHPDPRRFTTIFDASPVFGQAEDKAVVRALVDYSPIWSCNLREAPIIARKIEMEWPDDTDGGEDGAPEAYLRLSQALGSTLIVHVGPHGAWLCQDDQVRHIPGFPVTPVDTNGAGDCHTGVLCALLSKGVPLSDAISYANAAAALSVTKTGPATCPTPQEIQDFANTNMTSA